MFAFISYWRTAAVVLCDLASTAYYIGGIVEQSIGPAAPWLILAVMLFSYARALVAVSSCSLFVRGGVYRVVKEAMGGFLAKLSVSALMFDYILTGPTSGVSAGQYIVGLVLDGIAIWNPQWRVADPDTRDTIKNWGAVIIACGITLYFFRQNLIGIHESSGKALKIMMATTIMAVVILAWCGLTLAIQGPANSVWRAPNLSDKVQYELAARYKISDDTVISLRNAEVPELVRDALNPQNHKEFADEFDNTKPFKRLRHQRHRRGSRVANTCPRFWRTSKVVVRYDWNDKTIASLKEDGRVPEAIIKKLAPELKNQVIGTTLTMER